jgi:DNA recombination protein RmuC
MEYLIGFLIGAIVGAVVAAFVMGRRARAGAGQMRDAFAALSAEALDASSKRLAEQAGAVLDGKKALVDQSFTAMGERLDQVRELLQKVESQRQQDFGRLTGSVSQLAATTGELHRMLASTQRRGAWGERMAEDVLRLAGMIEGVNYRKQDAQAAAGGRERPDFTFLLPNDLVANMDVKFPLESYKAYLDAAGDDQRLASRRALAGAVRGHVRDVAGRGYVDPKASTVPYCIVFIPSEQIFALVMEESPDLMDEALQKRVVLCGPLTLYAMLAVIRQAAENANVVRTADEIVSLVAEFCRQWGKYNEEMDKLGQRLDSAAGQYESLRTTRTNVLQKLMDKIEGLRSARALTAEPSDRPGDGKAAE